MKPTALTNIQVELLKLFPTDPSEFELKELKALLAKFYADKSIQQANQDWEKKNLSQADMENWLNDPRQ